MAANVPQHKLAVAHLLRDFGELGFPVLQLRVQRPASLHQGPDCVEAGVAVHETLLPEFPATVEVLVNGLEEKRHKSTREALEVAKVRADLAK